MTTTRKKVYCFLGLPGSGKGTQIELLAKRISAPIISMGDEIRKELDSADLSDPFYRKMKDLYDQGIPQPDEVAADIVKKRIASADGELIFDNFPFSRKQAELFFEICRENSVSNPVLIVIKITPETSVQRVVYRKVCADCGHIMIDNGDAICEECGGALISRSDDNVETAQTRIKNYLPRIEEVESYFKEHGTVLEIDGSGTVSEVDKIIESKLGNNYA